MKLREIVPVRSAEVKKRRGIERGV